jgi:hypothetical protein
MLDEDAHEIFHTHAQFAFLKIQHWNVSMSDLVVILCVSLPSDNESFRKHGPRARFCAVSL